MSRNLQGDRLSKAASVVSETATESSCSLLLQQSQDAMNGETLRRKVTIQDPLGLHLRPLTAFAQQAARFQCSVTVAKEDQRVNGKSPLELMLLGAQQGTELVLEVSGSDAPAALEVLAELLSSPGLEDPPEEPLPRKG
jgi:phosphotransferase system HPr (HPr) family protein